MIHHFDAILFDFDGVLIDSEPVHFACWQEILSPHGIILSWDTYAKNGIGITDRELIEFLAGLANPPLDAESFYVNEYPKKRKLYLDVSLSNDPILPQTRDLLKSLKDYKLAVVSSSSRAEVTALLERGGILHHFTTLVCGKEAGRLKPDPDPYLLAADRLLAKRTLVVEDSDAGVASATAAGFPVLRLKHPRDLPSRLRETLHSGATLSLG